MADVFDAAEIAAQLTHFPAWTFDGAAVARTFDCVDFNGSIAFVNAVAAAANRLDHHPDIAVSWNEVMIRTSSHDVGGISARDFALVAAIEALR
jgi:4a-hydroxytetrahydrobiopterin dehydratase